MSSSPTNWSMTTHLNTYLWVMIHQQWNIWNPSEVQNLICYYLVSLFVCSYFFLSPLSHVIAANSAMSPHSPPSAPSLIILEKMFMLIVWQSFYITWMADKCLPLNIVPTCLKGQGKRGKKCRYAPANVSTPSSRLLGALLLHTMALIYGLWVNNCILWNTNKVLT